MTSEADYKICLLDRKNEVLSGCYPVDIHHHPSARMSTLRNLLSVERPSDGAIIFIACDLRAEWRTVDGIQRLIVSVKSAKSGSGRVVLRIFARSVLHPQFVEKLFRF